MAKTPKRTEGVRARKAAGGGGTELARLRKILRSIPGAVEKLSHGEPTWFTGEKGRVFAMFDNHHHAGAHISVYVPAPPGLQQNARHGRTGALLGAALRRPQGLGGAHPRSESRLGPGGAAGPGCVRRDGPAEAALTRFIQRGYSVPALLCRMPGGGAAPLDALIRLAASWPFCRRSAPPHRPIGSRRTPSGLCPRPHGVSCRSDGAQDQVPD